MATTQRDYYEVLGLSRGAGEPEIKKAFRRLARELHPDVSQQPEAEARFREAAEAYEVLSKQETRELYDRYGHAGLRGGGYQPGNFGFGDISDLFSAFFADDVFGVGGRSRQSRGGDVAAEVELELAEAARGIKREVRFSVAVRCGTCAGDGVEPGTSPTTCSGCGGSGRLQQVARSVFGDFLRSRACPRCGGQGRIVEHPCAACEGQGRVIEEHGVEVEIPAGIHDGQRIRITGQGHAAGPGGRAGDAYVLVRIKPHPELVRDGHDLVSRVDVTITQAALGGRVQVPTLEGEAELELAAGTQPGEQHVLRGGGMPVLQGFGRGDHRVVVNVVVPRRLDEKQRRLLEEFDESAGSAAYQGDDGLFEKLKNVFR